MPKRVRKWNNKPGLTPEVVRLVRYTYGLSMEELARKMNRSVGYISKIENGQSKLQGTQFEEFFLEYFGITPKKLTQVKRLITKIKTPEAMV